MSKIRSDSIWNSLPIERRKMFDHWLFEERIGYAEARARAEKEWGVTSSITSVFRYYRRAQMERVVEELEDITDGVDGVNGSAGKLDSLRASAMKVIGMQLLEKAVDRGDVKELAALGRVLTQSEEREIQRGRLALAREKFRFNAARAALKYARMMGKITQEEMEREDARMDEIERMMFGKNPFQPEETEHGL